MKKKPYPYFPMTLFGSMVYEHRLRFYRGASLLRTCLTLNVCFLIADLQLSYLVRFVPEAGIGKILLSLKEELCIW